MSDYITIGTIARNENRPIAAVKYIVQKNRIEESMRCGIVRLFSPAKVAEIRAALQTTRK